VQVDQWFEDNPNAIQAFNDEFEELSKQDSIKELTKDPDEEEADEFPEFPEEVDMAALQTQFDSTLRKLSNFHLMNPDHPNAKDPVILAALNAKQFGTQGREATEALTKNTNSRDMACDPMPSDEFPVGVDDASSGRIARGPEIDAHGFPLPVKHGFADQRKTGVGHGDAVATVEKYQAFLHSSTSFSALAAPGDLVDISVSSMGLKLVHTNGGHTIVAWNWGMVIKIFESQSHCPDHMDMVIIMSRMNEKVSLEMDESHAFVETLNRHQSNSDSPQTVTKMPVHVPSSPQGGLHTAPPEAQRRISIQHVKGGSALSRALSVVHVGEGSRVLV
jgi:hypothetical protein